MSAMTLLSSYLDDGGWHTEAENVRNGVDLESYGNELSLIGWLLRHAHLTQPAQSVDAEKVREVIARVAADNQKSALTLGVEGLRGQCIETAKELHKLAAAL